MDQTLALTVGQRFNPNTRGLNDSLAERVREGGGGGCHKIEGKKERKKRERDGRAGKKKLQQTLSYRERKIKQQRLME